MRSKISNKQFAEALYELTKDVEGDELTEVLTSFVKLLSGRQKLKQADNIIKEFETYSKKQEGIVSIEIKSARKLDNEVVDQIKEVFGRKVEAEMVVSKKMLGGISVRTEDKILDGSLKTQLNTLKLKLINN